VYIYIYILYICIYVFISDRYTGIPINYI
jgi:hypothetical protein